MSGNAVVVKLREKGTMFQDASQNRVIVGTDPVVAVRTESISEAIAAGRLIVVEGDEAKKVIAKYKKDNNIKDEDDSEKETEAEKAKRLKDEEEAKKLANK